MKSIRAKLLLAILGVAMGFGVIIAAAALVQMYTEAAAIRGRGEQQSQSVAEETSAALDEISQRVAVDFSGASTKYFDVTFENIHKNVRAVARKAEELYARGAYAGPVDENVGLVAGVSAEDIRAEFGVISPLRDYIKYMPQYDTANLGSLDLYFMSESGMCLDGTESALGNNYADLREEDWYQITKDKGRSYWSGVFTGKVSGRQKVICVEPVFDAQGQFMGCVAGDMEVASFQKILTDYDEEQIRSVLFFDVDGELMHATNNYQHADRVKQYLGLTSLASEDDEIYSFSHLPETGWVICTVLDQSDMLAAAAAVRENIEENARLNAQTLQESTHKSIITFIVIAVVGTILMVVITNILAASFSRPIREMMEQVRVIASGNLEKTVTVASHDEIGQLAAEFNHMTGELGRMVNNIQSMTAESERIAAELGVARQIQTGMLPMQFPAFPDRSDFDICASMTCADDDGSNFYDFFLVDRSHLCIVAGDVSGSGIPSTILSVVTMTHIKNYAKLGYEPGRILMETNNRVCSENSAKLTVSVFLGIVDLDSGMFSYVNAGDIIPLWKHSGSDFEFLKVKSGFALASMENIPYPQQTIRLVQNDMLFLHTAGIGEITDGKGNEYTNEYLHSYLNRLVGNSYALNDILGDIEKDLLRFSDNTPRKEDATMLIFRYVG